MDLSNYYVSEETGNIDIAAVRHQYTATQHIGSSLFVRNATCQILILCDELERVRADRDNYARDAHALLAKLLWPEDA